MLSLISLVSKFLLIIVILASISLVKQKEGQSMGEYNLNNSLKGYMILGVLIALSWL